MTKQIFKQILKEFWIPATIALIWTFANLMQEDGKINTISLIKEFGPAFFFVSWLLAQYWRVRKQLKVERNFISVEENLSKLTKNLEKKTDDLINHITGGNSYFYYRLGQQIGPDWFMIECCFNGDYTLQNNEVFFFSKNSNLKEQKLQLTSINKTIAEDANQQIQLKFIGNKIESSSFIFSSTGKKWFQMLDIKLTDRKLSVKSKIWIFNTNQEIIDNYEVDYIPASYFSTAQ